MRLIKYYDLTLEIIFANVLTRYCKAFCHGSQITLFEVVLPGLEGRGGGEEGDDGMIITGFVQNLNILECRWIWKQKFKALKVLEFIKKCLKDLEFV